MSDEQRVEHVWIGIDGAVFREKPRHATDAVEYMRVLCREEVEKLAFSEAGVDPMQLINSLHRTIDGQRREINMLKEKLAVRDRENGALAESYLAKMGLKPEDLR